MFERVVDCQYGDPVDLIWLQAARDLGLNVVRSADSYAAYDGNGILTIADEQFLDPDDCLAQMIFHEICHWLVAGRGGYRLEDWGLSNLDDRDLRDEHACHRVQAALAQPWGLRDFMAVTTDWRPYWDALPLDPLREGDDPAIPLAQEAFFLSQREPFSTVLNRSLSATAAIAEAVREFSPADSLWNKTKARHRLGSLLHEDPARTCRDCAWAIEDERGLSCRQHQAPEETAPPIVADERACERWEPTFGMDECGPCGACCREGFDILTVGPRDPFRQRHPELLQLRDDGRMCVPRPDGLCVALEGDGSEAKPYRCCCYATRPTDCRDFEVRGEACLLARRRVGLSR